MTPCHNFFHGHTRPHYNRFVAVNRFIVGKHHQLATNSIEILMMHLKKIEGRKSLISYQFSLRNFSMSGINSGHHYLPTCQILMILDNVEFWRYFGGHFENGHR